MTSDKHRILLLARANKLLAAVCAKPGLLRACPDPMLLGFINAIDLVRVEAEERARRTAKRKQA